ncbi:far upstream element-binding protein 1 [Tanacetum coccineum]|uniref:Far upstream element-binding protein 1 n=1 Tax=Tanacetum coccineum TaxID=301880 RepID=A0ABQ4WYP9_9ASTR
MDQKRKIDKYAKAKIEEPNQQLPKSLLKPGSDPTSDLCYQRIFEEDNRKAQHLAEAIAAGAQLGRKVYRIRNKELIKVLEVDFAGMIHIHRVSKATIGLLADTETNKHSQAYLDLVGTVEQVNMAEELILDKVLKTYSSVCYPVILMPPTVYGYEMKIHENKVLRVLGFERAHIVRMEMTSGAWIRVNPNPPRGGKEWERVVSVYGPRENVIKAVSLIHQTISEPMESFDAGNDFKEPTCAELIGGKNSGEGSEPTGSKQTEEAEHKEYGGTGKGKEAASGSGQTDK